MPLTLVDPSGLNSITNNTGKWIFVYGGSETLFGDGGADWITGNGEEIGDMPWDVDVILVPLPGGGCTFVSLLCNLDCTLSFKWILAGYEYDPDAGAWMAVWQKHLVLDCEESWLSEQLGLCNEDPPATFEDFSAEQCRALIEGYLNG